MFKFDLLENEEMVELFRQTELMLLKPTLAVLVLIYAPWAFFIKYDLYIKLRYVLLAWTLVILVYALNKFLLWQVNTYLLTTRRLITINYRTIFHKHVLETPLDRISNISYKTTGLFSSLFGYGNVSVQITGLMDPMVLKNVRSPGAIKDLLWRFHTQLTEKKPEPVALAEKKPQRPESAVSPAPGLKVRPLVGEGVKRRRVV